MSKAVLISIQPKWIELIAAGRKTAEIRKHEPKLHSPFKCYMYRTRRKWVFELLDKLGMHGTAEKLRESPGKVIGEFICDNIECFTTDYRMNKDQTKRLSKQSCLDMVELMEYEGSSPCLYAWHIKELVIYDTPKPISSFYKPDRCPYSDENGCVYPYHCYRSGQLKRCGEALEKAPQSWCYVEEVR